jgi:hypothetical protein
MTFDVRDQLFLEQQGWRNWLELFCVCRNCHLSTVFVVGQQHPQAQIIFESDNGLVNYAKSLSDIVVVERFVSLRDNASQKPPDHLPEEIKNAFIEGATCLAVECWNASAAMFRLCVDLATKPLLPEGEADGLNSKIRRDLGLRLPWLFKAGLLPNGLNDLSSCIREDGNDGAHTGLLTKDDAEDLLDFTSALLHRLFTEPERLRLADQRRKDRRAAREES